MFGELWESFTDALEGLGSVVHFLFRLIVNSPRVLLRFNLISQQIFNSGALSLIIIVLSGLFVGMVLGLQGFQLLQRFGSEEALGTAATIGLTFLTLGIATGMLWSSSRYGRLWRNDPKEIFAGLTWLLYLLDRLCTYS